MAVFNGRRWAVFWCQWATHEGDHPWRPMGKICRTGEHSGGSLWFHGMPWDCPCLIECKGHFWAMAGWCDCLQLWFWTFGARMIKQKETTRQGHIVTKLLRHRCGRSNLVFYDFWIHPPMSLLIRIASHCRGPSSLDRRTLEIATSMASRLEIFSKFTEISSFSTNKIAFLGYTGIPHFQTHPSIMLLVRDLYIYIYIYLSHDLPLCSHKMVAVLHPHFG